MAKLKKLVLLCTALMMTASVAALASCGEGKKPSSSPDVSDSTPTEGNSSPDDSSSVDGGDETPDDVVYYEEIVAGGEGSLTATELGNVWGEISFSVEEAGLYGVYAVDANANSVEVYFGPQGSTDDSARATNFIFNVEEAGDVTLATYKFFWGAETINFSYYVYKLDTLTIEEMTGEATLAANLRAPVIFNAPAAGDYLITADVDLTWYNTAEKSDDGTYSSAFLLSASEAGEILFYVMLNDPRYPDFDFTWEILTIADVALNAGENTVDLYTSIYREVSFTAPQNAIYSVAAESEQYSFTTGVYGVDEWGGMSWVEGNNENYFTFYLKAGETKTFHIYYSGYDLNGGTGSTKVETPVTVSSIEAADPANLAVGDNIFMATEEGVQATFTAEVAGTYLISDGIGTMWFEDTDPEWGADSYKEVTLAAGESVSFTVKYNNLVTIAIEKAPESINLSVGENTINVPAETAYLNFTDAEMDATYTLSFNGALVSIVLDQGGMQTEIFADTEFTYNPWRDYIITSKTGEAVENLAITVTFVSGAEGGGDIGGGEEETYAPLILGENAITVTVESYYCAGTNVTFTALEAGEYVLNIAEGEENADVYTLPDYEMVEFPYTFTLGAGESISFNVATTAFMTLTEDVIDLVLEKVGGETEEPVYVTESKTYTFADYTAGEQYAANEEHKLDEYITVTTTDCHFREELRIYDSPAGDNYVARDGIAIIASTNVITGITLNAGNKAGTLQVYGSVDGADWILIQEFTTAKAYADFTASWDNAGYKFLKLDAVGAQIRVKYMTLDMLVIASEKPAEPVEDKVTIAVDKNELTIGAGYYVTNDNALTLNGEYTFDWNVFVSNEDTEDVNDTVAVDDSYITVLVNGEEIESGAKITYSEDTVVTIVIKSSDTTKNTYVSFTVTKTPETVQPDNEWTNNY